MGGYAFISNERIKNNVLPGLALRNSSRQTKSPDIPVLGSVHWQSSGIVYMVADLGKLYRGKKKWKNLLAGL